MIFLCIRHDLRSISGTKYALLVNESIPMDWAEVSKLVGLDLGDESHDFHYFEVLPISSSCFEFISKEKGRLEFICSK
jgi:hypothetical protein